MRGNKVKAINLQAKLILIEWIQTLVKEEEKDQVTLSNILSLAPAFEYYTKGETVHISVFHPRWIKQKIKFFLKNSSVKLEDINLKFLQCNLTTYKI